MFRSHLPALVAGACTVVALTAPAPAAAATAAASAEAAAARQSQAIADAGRAATAARRSPRRARSHLGRASRRLRAAQRTTRRLQRAQDPVALDAAVAFASAATDAGKRFAVLARRSRGGLQLEGVRAVGRAARLQAQVTKGLAKAAGAEPTEDAIAALEVASAEQERLVATLRSTSRSRSLSSPRRRVARSAHRRAGRSLAEVTAVLVRILEGHAGPEHGDAGPPPVAPSQPTAPKEQPTQGDPTDQSNQEDTDVSDEA